MLNNNLNPVLNRLLPIHRYMNPDKVITDVMRLKLHPFDSNRHVKSLLGGGQNGGNVLSAVYNHPGTYDLLKLLIPFLAPIVIKKGIDFYNKTKKDNKLDSDKIKQESTEKLNQILDNLNLNNKDVKHNISKKSENILNNIISGTGINYL